MPTPSSSDAPLARPAFRWFFAGRAISLLGSAMAPVALAFAVLDASGRPGDLGIVLAARMVPMLAFLLIGGATADRLPRRVVLLVSHLGSALTQGAVAVLLLSGHYTLAAIAGLEFLNGLLSAFTTPALRGLVPELVAPGELQRANALLDAASNFGKILGPSACGLLVLAAGSGPAVAIDALSYLLAAGFLLRLPAGSRVPAARAGRRGLIAELREGWGVFRRTSWVWPVTGAFCVVNLLQTGSWQILGPQLAQRLGSAATWGFILSARGAGMLLMSALMYRLTFHRLLRAAMLGSALGALPLLALGARLDAAWVVVLAFVAGLGSSISSTGWDTSLQEHIPDAVLSRVVAYDDFFSYVAIPVGQLSVGPLSAAFGPYAVATTAGVGYAVSVLATLLRRDVRRLPHVTGTAPEPVALPG